VNDQGDGRIEQAELGMLNATRELLQQRGTSELFLGDLTLGDMDKIAWSGNPLHLVAVRRELARVPSGAVEYLAVRTPDGWPVAKGAIDYEKYPEAGTLFQLATHPQLQSLGIGALLMAGAEARITHRGLDVAMVGVEDEHHRARALYERQGYEAVGHESDSWDVQNADGTVVTHRAEVTVMRKPLP
jgi:ribosomal protein S18 acetylase RimI-like enzyme